MSPLEDLSESVKLLWCSSTTSFPRLYESLQCWHDQSPSSRELIVQTLQCLKNYETASSPNNELKFKVNYQGEVCPSIDPELVVAQLVEPDSRNPAFLTGLRLSLVDERGFRTPYLLSTVAEPFEESNIQVNLTPKFSFVDLHIGQSSPRVF